MLFDLATDPAEQHDLSGTHPEIVAEAARRMREAHAPLRP
jgi:hypothetical protein